MGDVAGGGADNLNYTSYTYEQLRAAVYAVREDAIRTGVNEWADLARRANERVGTLRVAVAKLTPDWVSPGGRTALGKLASQRDWMAELARVATWNEHMLTDVYEARLVAVEEMRALDALPDPKPDNSTPAPSPGPDPDPQVDPASNWRQPKAARIASALYSAMAVAAASMALPPASPDVRGPTDGVPGDGPVAPGYTPGGGRGPGRGGSGSSGPTVGTSVAKTGDTGPGLVLGGSRPVATSPASGGVRAPTSGLGSGTRPGSTPGTAPGRGGQTPGPTGRGASQAGAPSGHGRGGGSGSGAGPGRTGNPFGGRPGLAGPGGGPGTLVPGTDPGSRMLGGGPRPAAGAPHGPGGVADGTHGPPGGVPPGGAGAGRGERRGKKKPGYERADPELFVDGRSANAAGGVVRGPAPERSFSPMPGMLGNQRQKTPDEQGDSWDVPERTASPEGFPDELRDFTKRDGTQFEVRRRTRGTGS